MLRPRSASGWAQVAATEACSVRPSSHGGSHRSWQSHRKLSLLMRLQEKQRCSQRNRDPSPGQLLPFPPGPSAAAGHRPGDADKTQLPAAEAGWTPDPAPNTLGVTLTRGPEDHVPSTSRSDTSPDSHARAPASESRAPGEQGSRQGPGTAVSVLHPLCGGATPTRLLLVGGRAACLLGGRPGPGSRPPAPLHQHREARGPAPKE